MTLLSEKEKKIPELRVLMVWTEFLEWLLTTDKFPKKVRFTLSNWIDNLALDFVEHVIDAQYTRDRKIPIRKANLILDKLRILLRIAHKLTFLPHKQYEYANRQIDEVGRMLGAWGKAEL